MGNRLTSSDNKTARSKEISNKSGATLSKNQFLNDTLSGNLYDDQQRQQVAASYHVLSTTSMSLGRAQGRAAVRDASNSMISAANKINNYVSVHQAIQRQQHQQLNNENLQQHLFSEHQQVDNQNKCNGIVDRPANNGQALLAYGPNQSERPELALTADETGANFYTELQFEQQHQLVEVEPSTARPTGTEDPSRRKQTIQQHQLAQMHPYPNGGVPLESRQQVSATRQSQQQSLSTAITMQSMASNTSPYHLSRAVNSKTSEVLDNSSQQQQATFTTSSQNHYSSQNNADQYEALEGSVAMPNGGARANHRHRRVSNSESWSKQQQQQILLQTQTVNNTTSRLPQSYQYQNCSTDQQPAHLYANRLSGGQAGQLIKSSPAHYPYNNNNNNNNNDEALDHQRQQQLVDDVKNNFANFKPYTSSHKGSEYDGQVQANEDLEEYYSRNLHILNQQQAEQNSLYCRHQQPVSGYMSAPSQRRYKWPKQQYQYLNQNQSELIAHPDAVGTNIHQATLDYRHLNSRAQFVSPGTPLYDYNRSYSFGSGSKTLDIKRKSSNKKNPLASLFLNNSSSSKNNSLNHHHSNTIHLSSSKSHQTLSSAASASQRSYSGGSLKRIKSSPLTAQQASYEAMRTIDMYLIRQIARSCMVSNCPTG